MFPWIWVCSMHATAKKSFLGIRRQQVCAKTARQTLYCFILLTTAATLQLSTLAPHKIGGGRIRTICQQTGGGWALAHACLKLFGKFTCWKIPWEELFFWSGTFTRSRVLLVVGVLRCPQLLLSSDLTHRVWPSKNKFCYFLCPSHKTTCMA